MAELDRYSFKVDGCLGVFSIASSEKEAREKLQRLWPRSTLTFVGVNRPESDRTIIPTASKPALKSKPGIRTPVASVGEPSIAGLTATEKSIIDAYAGHS